MLAMLAAMFAREYLRAELIEAGIGKDFAADLSFFVVPVISLVLLWPLLRTYLSSLRYLVRPSALTLRVALMAVLVAVLMRIGWWSSVFVRGAFGIGFDAPTQRVLSLAYNCPPFTEVAVSVLAIAMLTPVIEELLHRGVIQSALASHGKTLAILLASVIFAAFHTPSNYVFAFLAGLVFGQQFWISRSLWAPIISHGTYNGLTILDWRCTSNVWTPGADELPMVGLGVFSALTLASSIVAIVLLIFKARPGARSRPGPTIVKAR